MVYRTDPRPSATLTITVRADDHAALAQLSELAAGVVCAIVDGGDVEVTGGGFASSPDEDGRRVSLDLHATAADHVAGLHDHEADELDEDEAEANAAVEAALSAAALGGGWYEIEGEKYHGRANALAALADGDSLLATRAAALAFMESLTE